mmetsp:Transcript_24024/g.54207  ORF Transcript_24024/g.54207 Transcript_24024/m.54207 type:complete len:212 (+) Transcript_24024:723-1358(+)
MRRVDKTRESLPDPTIDSSPEDPRQIAVVYLRPILKTGSTSWKTMGSPVRKRSLACSKPSSTKDHPPSVSTSESPESESLFLKPISSKSSSISSTVFLLTMVRQLPRGTSATMDLKSFLKPLGLASHNPRLQPKRRKCTGSSLILKLLFSLDILNFAASFSKAMGNQFICGKLEVEIKITWSSFWTRRFGSPTIPGAPCFAEYPDPGDMAR